MISFFDDCFFWTRTVNEISSIWLDFRRVDTFSVLSVVTWTTKQIKFGGVTWSNLKNIKQ